jgi:geranylgeranyl pyrophosphate synthase
MMADHRSLEYARTRAIAFGEAAKRQLAVFPDRSERDALMALADYVVSRDR